MSLRRRWRRLWSVPGPRYCRACGQQLDYTMRVEHDQTSGRVKRWQWAAACPESSVVFWSGGGWIGNGHSYSHSLLTAVGPPAWAMPMNRALTMRRILRSNYPSGYGERLYETVPA